MVNFFNTICVSKFGTQTASRRIEDLYTTYLFEGHSVSNSDTAPIEKSALARAFMEFRPAKNVNGRSAVELWDGNQQIASVRAKRSA